MGFLATLKKTFIYTGEPAEEEDVKSELTKDTKAKEKHKVDVQEWFSTKAQQIKSKVTEEKEQARNSGTYARAIIYRALHRMVMDKIKITMPYEEACLLYKKFMEDKCVNEDFYSANDKLFLKGLVEVISDLRSLSPKSSDTLEDVATELCESDILLPIMEVLDLDLGLSCLKTSVDRSYIIVGAFYQDNPAITRDRIQAKDVFNIKSHEVTFSLLNEIAPLVLDLDQERKDAYVKIKITPPLINYLINEEKSTLSLLCVMLELSKAYARSKSATTTVVKDEPTVPVKETERYSDRVLELKKESDITGEFDYESVNDKRVSTPILKEVGVEHVDSLKSEQERMRNRYSST